MPVFMPSLVADPYVGLGGSIAQGLSQGLSQGLRAGGDNVRAAEDRKYLMEQRARQRAAEDAQLAQDALLSESMGSAVGGSHGKSRSAGGDSSVSPLTNYQLSQALNQDAITAQTLAATQQGEATAAQAQAANIKAKIEQTAADRNWRIRMLQHQEAGNQAADVAARAGRIDQIRQDIAQLEQNPQGGPQGGPTVQDLQSVLTVLQNQQDASTNPPQGSPALQDLQAQQAEAQQRLADDRNAVLWFKRDQANPMPPEVTDLTGLVRGVADPSGVALGDALAKLRQQRADRAAEQVARRGTVNNLPAGYKRAYDAAKAAADSAKKAKGTIRNPATSVGLSPGSVLNPDAVARAITLQVRTGDNSGWSALGIQTPPKNPVDFLAKTRDYAQRIRIERAQADASAEALVAGKSKQDPQTYIDILMSKYGTGKNPLITKGQASSYADAIVNSDSPVRMLSTLTGSLDDSRQNQFAMSQRAAKRQADMDARKVVSRSQSYADPESLVETRRRNTLTDLSHREAQAAREINNLLFARLRAQEDSDQALMGDLDAALKEAQSRLANIRVAQGEANPLTPDLAPPAQQEQGYTDEELRKMPPDQAARLTNALYERWKRLGL